MTHDEAEKIFQLIFQAFPQFRNWLVGTNSPKETHALWCKVISHCENYDAIVVADQLICGQIAMPEAYERDKLPQLIRRESNALRSERFEKKKQDKLRKNVHDVKDVGDRFVVAMRWSRRLGLMVRDGELDKETNDTRVMDLVKWSERDGPLPDWMTEGSSPFGVTKPMGLLD